MTEQTDEDQKKVETRSPDKRFGILRRFIPGRRAIRDDEEKSKTPMSRRSFIKKMLIGTAAIAIESKFRPLGRLASIVEKPLREKGILQEANLAQVFTKTEEILSNYLNEPSEENKRLLEAWLKFNGAIHYGAEKGMDIASAFASHFLYGEGMEFDATKLIETQVDLLLGTLSKDPDYKAEVALAKTKEEKIALLFRCFFSSKEYPKLMRGVTNGDQQLNSPSTETMTSGIYLRSEANDKQYFVGKPNSILKNKTIRAFTTTEIMSESPYFGLGRFTVGIRGKATHSSPTFGVTIENPVLYLLDVYDWKKGTDLGVDTTIGDIIRSLRLEKLFEDSRFDSFKNTMVSINDEDGAILAEKGYAHKFDVIGEWAIRGEFQIENTTMVAPPLEFQKQNNVNLTRLQ